MSKFILTGWEDNDDSFCVLLIATHLDDYRLAYLINKQHNLNFVNVTTQKGVFSNQKSTYFNIYQSDKGVRSECAYLVHNQIVSLETVASPDNLFSEQMPKSKPLLKTCQQWPFFLLSFQGEELRRNLRLMRDISAIQLIDFQHLSKNEQQILNNIFYEN